MSNYFGLAYQFFNLTREAINEMVNQGNFTTTFTDPQPTREDSWKLHDKLTRWNDFNIGVPVLFNFYHGLELFMKGILYKNGYHQKTSHNLTGLLDELKSIRPEVPPDILNLLELHLSKKSPFNGFFKTNDLNVDKYYELLKYPESKKGIEFYFFDIRGKESEGLENFKVVRQTTIDLKNEIVKWNQNLNKKIV